MPRKFGPKDVVGVTYDFGTSQIEFFVNGASVAKTSAKLAAPVHFVASCDNSGRVNIADWPAMSDKPVSAVDYSHVT